MGHQFGSRQLLLARQLRCETPLGGELPACMQPVPELSSLHMEADRNPSVLCVNKAPWLWCSSSSSCTAWPLPSFPVFLSTTS